jgi:hypothetical protein
MNTLDVIHSIVWGRPTAFGKGLQILLWSGSRVADVKFRVSGIPNRLYYCVLCVVYTW